MNAPQCAPMAASGGAFNPAHTGPWYLSRVTIHLAGCTCLLMYVCVTNCCRPRCAHSLFVTSRLVAKARACVSLARCALCCRLHEASRLDLLIHETSALFIAHAPAQHFRCTGATGFFACSSLVPILLANSNHLNSCVHLGVPMGW